MSSPSIFISYSHKDEEWKDRIVSHLGVLKMENIIDVWDDRRIEAGDDWHAEIDNAIITASIAILIISANFLTSKFIIDEEVKKLLERRVKEGVRVIPVIAKPCAWTQVKWLSSIQARPKDGKPLSAGSEHQIDVDLAKLANEIAGIVKRAGIIPDPKLFIPLPPDKTSLAKLPSTSPIMFGRDSRFEELDAAWANLHLNIFTIVAWGGVGKSALVNNWLSQMARDNYRGAERVYGWSFYSQGATEGRQVSADQFIASALAWFGDPDPNLGSPWDKGQRLAELVKQSRSLIILDGLEPLQSPPPIDTGRIKDPALAAFLRELARQNPGMVLITTRVPLDDLKEYVGSTVIECALDNLAVDAGASYLKYLGVNGSENELQEATREFDGHALALTLMGTYLKVVYYGDIRKLSEIPSLMDDRKQGSRARRMMASYEAFLKDKPELNILRLMGLFDRPAEKGALDALMRGRAIEGLTTTLQKLNNVGWQYAINNLRELRLLSQTDVHEPDNLDCHPLLREYFGEKQKTENLKAWQEAHSLLYEYYKSVAKEMPDTLDEMAPLFAAVMHGCQADRYQDVYDDVFRRRIRREKDFLTGNLGAFGSQLAAIANFFETPWSRPSRQLEESNQGWLLNEAGYCLRAVGRPVETAQPMRASLDIAIEQKEWNNAAIAASNLSELYLAIGDIAQALTSAEQSVELADRDGDVFQRLVNRTKVADALNQAGQLTESQTMFREAEELQKLRQPEIPILYSFAGFLYCDLLLNQGNYVDVKQRAEKALEIVLQTTKNLLIIGLNYLSLGRAYFLQSQHESIHSLTEPQTYLNLAVNSLREAGDQEFVARSLLARAEYYRITGNLNKAQTDIDEAYSIATQGGMGLYLADCHLEYAWLDLEKEDKVNAHKNWKTAKEMIEKMGYHKRDKDATRIEVLLR
jgi:tetratricopeptide (TPR) repeat protein